MTFDFVRRSRAYLPWVAAVAAILLVGFAILSSVTRPAEAAKGGTCSSFTVSTDGRSFSGDQDRTIRASQVGQTIAVRGKYIKFTARSRDFAVLNYKHTGANSPRADKNLPINGETLTSGVSLDLNNEAVVLERSGGGQDMKIQAKDCQQGGLFQMEPEPRTTEKNTLGPDFHYTVQPPGQERLCFTNGRFTGYDSPELATLVRHTNKVAKWDVRSGGRIGMVIGEDAVEGGCTLR